MANEKRLIDANDVYALFDEAGTARLHVADIDLIPRVDAVEVVHGMWVETKNGFHCSNCKKKPGSHPTKRGAFLSDYCPNCGADMRGSEK